MITFFQSQCPEMKAGAEKTVGHRCFAFSRVPCIPNHLICPLVIETGSPQATQTLRLAVDGRLC
jgi:hypothetical protein